MGNYVSDRVGNYVSGNPLQLGNYVNADTDKVPDVVGLYLDPPAGAVVLSFDEKTQIQALDRTQPLLHRAVCGARAPPRVPLFLTCRPP